MRTHSVSTREVGAVRIWSWTSLAPLHCTSTVFRVRSINKNSPHHRAYPEYNRVNGPRRARMFLRESIKMAGKNGVTSHAVIRLCCMGRRCTETSTCVLTRRPWWLNLAPADRAGAVRRPDWNHTVSLIACLRCAKGAYIYDSSQLARSLLRSY